MSFIAKNPLILPEIKHTPSTPPGTRGIFAAKDGLYEVDSNNNVTLISKNGGDSGNVDLSDYYTKDETTQLVDSKISSVYKYCGSVDDLYELINVSYKNIGDTYNVKAGGSVQFYFEPSNWECVVTTDNEGKTYLRIKDNGVDITNAIPKGYQILPWFSDGLYNLTEYGWEISDIIANLPPEWDKQMGYNLHISCNADDNVVWTGFEWDVLSGIVDLSNYYDKDSIEKFLQEKQDVSNIIQSIDDYREDAYPSEKAVRHFVYDLLDREIIEANTFMTPNIATSYAVVNYVKEKINEVVNTFRGNIESVNQLPTYEINENVGDAYNIFSYDSTPEVLKQSKEVSWSGDVTQKDNSYYLTIIDEKGNDITQSLPTGLTLNAISSEINFSLDTKTADGWEVPAAEEMQEIGFVEYTAPDLVQSPIEGDYAVWNGYYWSTLMDTLYSNYFTREQTQALISGELDKLPIEDGREDYSVVQKTDLIAWETNSFDSFQDIEEIKNIEGIKFDDTKENIFIGAYGKNSVSLGGKSQAVGSRSLVEGSKNISIGDNSHAEGELNIVIGGDSHGEGIGNFIEAHNAHSEGNGNKIGVGGNNAHAEGYHNEVDADSAHVEGSNNEVHGAASHVGGVDSKTTSEAGTAFAHGQGVIANRGTQIVLGSYNKEDNTKVFILGNGTDNDHRKNIFTIDDNGNAIFAGDLEINGAGIVKDFQLENFYTKDEVNSKISSVYKYCGSVNNLNELSNISTKAIGDTYNIINGGSKSISITPEWEYITTEIYGIAYLRIIENGIDITNLIPKGLNLLPWALSLTNLTEYGWKLDMGIPPYWDGTYYGFNISCKDGDNVAWTGFEWDVLSGIVDLNNYYTKTQTDKKINDLSSSVDTRFLNVNTDLNNKQEKINMINGSIYIGMSPDDWEGSYPSTPTMMQYVIDYTSDKLGKAEELTAAIIALQNSYIGGETA